MLGGRSICTRTNVNVLQGLNQRKLINIKRSQNISYSYNKIYALILQAINIFFYIFEEEK